MDAADFGVVANDEQTDNAKFLQAAFEYAGKKGIRYIKIPAGTYFISRGFNIKDSVTIAGAGMEKTILKLISNLPARSNEETQTAVFTGTQAYSLSHSPATRNITIKSMTIDLQKPEAEFNIEKFSMLGGIRFINAVNCIVDSVKIINPPKFGIGLYATKSGEMCNNNTVKHCVVVMQPGWFLQLSPEIIPRSNETCIGIELASFTGPHNNGTAIYIKRNNENYFPSKTRKNSIRDNVISGGSHGISVSNSSNNRIEKNNITGCSNRGIIIISCSDSNMVLGNSIFNSGSTAVHLAYSCNYNTIKANRVSGVMGIEGDGIKSYINCNYNRITGNIIDGFAKTGIRISHGANNNFIEYNKITGNNSAGQTGIKIMANNKRQYEDGLKFDDVLTARNNNCSGNIISGTETGLLLGDEMNFKKSTGNNKTDHNKFKSVKKKFNLRKD